jgi:hypothetical protein
MAILHEGCRRVMQAAYRRRKDGQLFHGAIEAPDVLRDSRPPQVWSNILTRFRFAPSDGSRETWIINFASHSESLLGKNSLVSADFPCYLRREILEKNGAETIYFVGAIGGLIRPKELDEDNVKSTILCGEQLGQAAIQIQDERKLPALLNILHQPYAADAENLMLLTAEKLGVFHGKRVVTETASTGAAILTEMTYMNLGGLQMLLLPCELFPELAYGGFLSAEESATGFGAEINPIPLRELAKDDNLIVFGLGNDELGYIVPPNDYMLDAEKPFIEEPRDRHGRKHYEETNGAGPNTAFRIAETFEKILRIIGR